MQVPINLCDIVTLCMSFEGWTFVFVRTPFGWKWATHTFSVFTAALKCKLQNSLSKWLASRGSAGSVEAHGTKAHGSQWCKAIEDGLGTKSLSRRARLVWARFMAFCYVDDVYGISKLLGNRPHIFADCLRAAGGMLMGHVAWFISKVKEDGLYAWLHKF